MERLDIARALLNKPAVILAGEPTSAEAAMIAFAAFIAGLDLSALIIWWGTQRLADQTGLLLKPNTETDDLGYLAAGALAVAALAALFPAIRAARTPIEELLQS